MPKENKAEHHRSHRLAVVETVNICFLVGSTEKYSVKQGGGTGSDDAYFFKSTHLFFV